MTPPPADTYFARLLDPRVRGYLVTIGAALAVVFVALFQRGQLFAAVFPVAIAAPGLLLRWTAMPGIVVVVVSYLLVFPTGIPFEASGFADVRSSHFEATDLMFVPAVLCYLAAQYRLYGLTVRAVPDDRPKLLQKPTDPQPRRPADGIPPAELKWLFAGIAVAVLGGQLVWLFVTRLDLAPAEFPPVQSAERGASTRLSRFVLFGGILAGVGIAAGLVFWYWRLSRMNADEARVALIDAGWSEVRREAARQETWRVWGRPGGRTGERLSFWAGLRVPITLLFVLVALGLVLRMIWYYVNAW